MLSAATGVVAPGSLRISWGRDPARIRRQSHEVMPCQHASLALLGGRHETRRGAASSAKQTSTCDGSAPVRSHGVSECPRGTQQGEARVATRAGAPPNHLNGDNTFEDHHRTRLKQPEMQTAPSSAHRPRGRTQVLPALTPSPFLHCPGTRDPKKNEYNRDYSPRCIALATLENVIRTPSPVPLQVTRRNVDEGDSQRRHLHWYAGP